MNAVTKTKDPEQLLPADPMVSMIERIAMDPNSDLAKLEKMLEMKERHDANEAKKAFNASWALASSEMPEIPLNGYNEHTKKRYALLKDIMRLTRPVLSKFGLALSFATSTTKDEVIVTALLSHEAGHVRENTLPLPRDTGPGRNAVQTVGSSQTYGERYTAQAILGLSLGEEEDDDGRASGKPVQDEAARKPYSWANTITADMPENSTPREKAEAVAAAICAQWNRMKGIRQIDNEWDRRASLISELESKHSDLWGNVIEGYEQRRHQLDEQRAEKERQ